MKDELNDLTKFIDSNINEVEKKLESMNVEAEEHQSNSGNAVNGGDMQAHVHEFSCPVHDHQWGNIENIQRMLT
ncbi:hypothetical protein RYX36_016048 [Vicia faba]